MSDTNEMKPLGATFMLLLQVGKLTINVRIYRTKRNMEGKV